MRECGISQMVKMLAVIKGIILNISFKQFATDYSIKFVSAVEKENIFGTQFHPEKSQLNGIKIFEII